MSARDDKGPVPGRMTALKKAEATEMLVFGLALWDADLQSRVGWASAGSYMLVISVIPNRYVGLSIVQCLLLASDGTSGWSVEPWLFSSGC